MRNGWCLNMFGDLKHYVNEKCHNEKGPVVIYYNGTKGWCQNHKYHRLDGPAFERPNGYKEWWYQGKPIECNSQKEFERYLKLKLLW